MIQTKFCFEKTIKLNKASKFDIDGTTAITADTLKFWISEIFDPILGFGGMTAITADAFKIGWQNDHYNTKDLKNREKWPNDRYYTTRSNIAQCYRHLPVIFRTYSQ